MASNAHIASTNVGNGTADQTSGAIDPAARTSLEADSALAAVTPASDFDRANETPATPAEDQVAYDKGVAESEVDGATAVQCGDTKSRLDSPLYRANAAYTQGVAQSEQAKDQLNALNSYTHSMGEMCNKLSDTVADGADEAHSAEANREGKAVYGCVNNKEVETVMREMRVCFGKQGNEHGGGKPSFVDEIPHDHGNGTNGDSTGPSYDNTSNGDNGGLIGPSHGGSEYEVNGGPADRGHGGGDNETGGLTNPDLGLAPRGDSEDEVNGDSIGRGHNTDSNEVNGAPTRPGEEAGDPFRKRVMRKRLMITSGILAAIILITASALKAAGYAYHDIQWPITIEVMITTILLSPGILNAIA